MRAVRLAPCWRCPLRAGCTLRKEWLTKVSGLGLTSAAFHCPKLAEEIHVGRRIVITAPVSGTAPHAHGEPGEPIVLRKEVKATVTRVEPAHRFRCTVDPGELAPDEILNENTDPEKIRFRATQRHYRIIRFLDEPDAEVGKGVLCGHVQRNGICDEPRTAGQASCAEVRAADQELVDHLTKNGGRFL